jgi:hypothetical protein
LQRRRRRFVCDNRSARFTTDQSAGWSARHKSSDGKSAGDRRTCRYADIDTDSDIKTDGHVQTNGYGKTKCNA